MVRKAAVCLAILGVFSLPFTSLYAQEAAQVDQVVTEQVQRKRVVRVVEAVPLWVDAEKLRVRDNPFAGDVIGLLDMGQKVKAYERADNWVRVSPNGKPTKWVNGDFLSKRQVSWANYDFGFRSRGPRKSPYDANLKRIKIKSVKDMKVYSAQIKQGPNDSRIIITRHDFRSGSYYEKRMVGCESGGATHVRMLGEGYNYKMMESDPRASRLPEPFGEDSRIDDQKTSDLNRGIARFACEAKGP